MGRKIRENIKTVHFLSKDQSVLDRVPPKTEEGEKESSVHEVILQELKYSLPKLHNILKFEPITRMFSEVSLGCPLILFPLSVLIYYFSNQ